MADPLRDIVVRNRAGAKAAIPSVCSAQPDVLRASLLRAQALDRAVVIEATSNQVNQDGGYTGITPDGFIGYVHDIADKSGVDRDRIIFGGDHLGPQAWRVRPAQEAMDKARVLVRDYVKAGFRKIHLDCSEGCAGEPAQLGDEKTAERSADLAQVCVDACDNALDGLLFVIGTEVPPPGGARVDEEGDIPPTDSSAAKATLDAHANSFGDMATLIGGLVVQPGVEFSPTAVHHMPLERDPGLLAALDSWSAVCLEAHSTDYQHPAVFPRLAELGFAFQKIGPALTFAYRQALYALDQICAAPGSLEAEMEKVMLANPAYWQGHYHGDAKALYHQRHFGLADRIRYYWPDPAAQTAVAALRSGFDSPIPNAELQKVFDDDVLTRAEQLTGDQVQRLIDAQIQLALDPYFFDEAT
ncbi:class II D-tagatose-bisphosphate aldolase, non-catalytic subunit [Aliiroseovarius sp. F47248L]|uniref:class II D-tagatose-bisphosphate aldolase non-catalytic subunit n=1 Tax=Aliiroseovarius sp. F47248L TaxID=2926420 RepID=UPI001FF184EE|nr:class II D-tagatose-bisphosphate aldolase, non-catalytic subunit [Aliiroseovarius sp. F47248L]MCK0138526.1 class II D-tagatose-bisphosphate aldolase, non-catalytic subunit [Aliiroseovarius sp. F47248L]